MTSNLLRYTLLLFFIPLTLPAKGAASLNHSKSVLSLSSSLDTGSSRPSSPKSAKIVYEKIRFQRYLGEKYKDLNERGEHLYDEPTNMNKAINSYIQECINQKRSLLVELEKLIEFDTIAKNMIARDLENISEQDKNRYQRELGQITKEFQTGALSPYHRALFYYREKLNECEKTLTAQGYDINYLAQLRYCTIYLDYCLRDIKKLLHEAKSFKPAKNWVAQCILNEQKNDTN